MEKVLVNVCVLDSSQLDILKVMVFFKVKIKNIKLKKEFIYYLVFESEVDLKVGKIFVNLLIGKGLFGKVVGEIVIVEIL